ncbi:carboxypeptidase regulatory-like domain-containing protein [Longimicrobium terrae]|uniref:TonB-dependent receptor plug domain-containing protein n=1 Tax=Longimicrobium terrae TaxID=1639882 RepID=A0A841H6T1_9BACT|nr:carboxypeptidase regulatory-like domain-containing protein [Longimicrobium terrae]MBB4638188.1 hypothetical protein [Longimicrobium terrae]MBB6073653.1 hypothetical protein [Longimicrobium terrae]NNC30331.1 hypothetical protein [Longimicrobium terrae]
MRTIRPSLPRVPAIIPAALLASALLAPLPASASAKGAPSSLMATQAADGTIQGELVEEGTGRPIAGALVVLMNEAGARLTATLTDTDGRFVLRVRNAGRYSLRAERVGYATTTSRTIDLEDGATVTQRLTARVRGVELQGIAVRARSRCERTPDAGPATQLLWEEIRKALESTAWTQQEGLHTYVVRHWTRDMGPVTLRIARETTRMDTTAASTPFRTAPAAELRDRGWVQAEDGETVFYGPDAAALLAPEFLETHCFRAVPHPTDATRVGLAFEPVRGRGRPDVRGTLWVARDSAALREMEFGYTGLEGSAYDRRMGGWVNFDRLASGAWIVRRWNIRTPMIRESRPGGAIAEPEQQIVAFREDGAEIMEVRPRGGEARMLGVFGSLRGTVWDSTAAAPLAGALVFLEGTEYTAATDSTGSYVMDGVPPGIYGLSFAHARLDSLGYEPPFMDAAVAESAVGQAALAVPSMGRIVAMQCADSAGAVLYGTVNNAANGFPLPAAAVRLAWPDDSAPGGLARAERTTDTRGRYLFCGLPAGVSVRVSGEFVGRPLPTATLALAQDAPREHAIAADALGRIQVGGFTMTTGARAPVRVSGRLTMINGAPLASGMSVHLVPMRLAEGDTASPRQVPVRENGEFIFGRVIPGEYQMDVVDASQRMLSRPLAVGGGESMQVDLEIDPATFSMDPVIVTARPRMGVLTFNREQIVAEMKHSTHAMEMLRRVREVIVTPSRCVGLRAEMNYYRPYSRSTPYRPLCRPMTIIVDGVPLEPRDNLLRVLPLEEIESIEILNPHAAASRYPNNPLGVMLVTTRRPASRAPAAP